MVSRVFLPFPFQLRTGGIISPLHVRLISSPKVRFYPRFICSAITETIEMEKYRNKFAKRMSLAGLKPHHRIAIAVSGGPDSIALCLLTAGWKTDKYDTAKYDRSESIDGLLAIVVDHRLRKESTEEANLVRDRVVDMGIKCEVTHCEWLNGKPQTGHVQEEARNKRYEILQNVCLQQQIGVLLVAHHSDDQAELLILRLSRNSGVLGLGGMAFSSQMFPNVPDFNGAGSKTRGLLLVRPLLDFSKEDMYNICRGGNQPWVEDPTNKSQLYARNRIRESLSQLSSPTFKTELQALISACRKTRLHVDKLCRELLNQAVTIAPDGYALIDLAILHSLDAKDIVLAKFITLVLQFISQRHRPVRGNAQKLLLSYLRTFPCKSCLTVANCYLCPAPGSKGTKLLACCSVHPSLSQRMELFTPQTYEGHTRFLTTELPHIITDSEGYLNKLILNPSDLAFLDVTSSESVLSEAKRLGVLSDFTHKCILSLQQEESDIFTSKPDIVTDLESSNPEKLPGATNSKLMYPGHMGYFMDRFILNWKLSNVVSHNISSETEEKCLCCSCIINEREVAEVRAMVDADWLYLADLSRQKSEEDSQTKYHSGVLKNKQVDSKRMPCLVHAVTSAHRALVRLKSIPVAARRSLPVLVNTEGLLLSIPSVGFSRCPRLLIYSAFYPRIPLGGGHTSFL